MAAIRTYCYPQAQKMEFFFKPMLKRAEEVWRKSRQTCLLSEFAGGNMLVLTFRQDGEVHQVAFCTEDLTVLPEAIRNLVAAERKKPGSGGTFTFRP